MRSKKYSHNTGLRTTSGKVLRAGAAVLVIGVSAAVVWWVVQSPETPQTQQPDVSHEQPAQGPSSDIVAVQGRYLFSGTVVPARAVENEARQADGTVDYAQPFRMLNTFHPDQYDGWMIDFECPMTVNDIPYSIQVSNTVFNCPDEFAPELAKYFTIANVANNHTRDQGDEGFDETVRHLEAAGIQTVGHWNPRQKDQICEVVALPVRLQKVDESTERGTLPIAFCAWHYFEQDPLPEEYAVMDQYAEIMPVFAFSQVGVEYRDSADPKQIEIAHTLIDNHDPEFVIENSAHWVQNTEAYKGKLVVYSTGNFIFDQLDAETNRGLNIDAKMTIPYDENVQAWLDLGKICAPRGDSCLEIARERKLKKINLSLSYDVVGSSTGYKQLTQKADPALQAAIETRANWKATLEGLQ